MKTASGFACWMLPTLIGAATANAQTVPGVQVEDARFLPPRFSVGDRVQLRLVLSTDAVLAEAKLVAGTGRDGAAESLAITVDSIALTPLAARRWSLTVTFRSFQPGLSSLPQIDLGGGAVINLPKVQTATTLSPSAAELSAAKGPILLRGTVARLLLVISALLVVPTTATTVARGGRRLVLRFINYRARMLPRRRFERDLRGLTAEPNRGPAYTAELARLIRYFLAARLLVPAQAQTVAEIAAAMEGVGMDQSTATFVVRVLGSAERFTFGGEPLAADTAEQLASDAGMAIAAADRELSQE